MRDRRRPPKPPRSSPIPERTITTPLRLCFVCLGNICRSPTAEAVMRHLVHREGLAAFIEVESAGTGSFHVGERADERACEAAARRGYVLDRRARHFVREMFVRYDYVLAMDRSNLRDLVELAGDEVFSARTLLLRSFDPAADGKIDVPDPYYGGPCGFEHVLDICEAACAGLLAELRRRHRL